MAFESEAFINTKDRYLQIAFDRNLASVSEVLPQIPNDDRILVEVGTPLIKQYGASAIAQMRSLCENYLVADVKAMDRGVMEVEIASSSGADAVVVLGSAPIETLDFFIETCKNHGVDSMIDMINLMNLEKPVRILQKLKKQPDVVILHRGFDEYTVRNKQLPLAEISDIRDHYSTPISVAGCVDLDDIQRAFFNGANVVVMTDTLTPPQQLPKIAKDFLKNTR
ncbi:MAG: orotidine 5'-phosphate decarboxylase / HUMPS family protein [Candidatus Altiarchaeota archaeon]